MYRLMMPEIRVLRAGYEVEQELQELADKGVNEEKVAGLHDFEERLKENRAANSEPPQQT